MPKNALTQIVPKKGLPPQEIDWPDGAVFTVGHSTVALDLFIAVLKAYGIETLVDIRTIPRSRRNPQYSQETLPKSLAAAHITYIHMPALGGLRHPRKDSPNKGWRNENFRGYADYMQTDAFRDAIAKLIELSARYRLALMCAEAVPWRCHRSLVADALCVRNVPVIDILNEAKFSAHKLTPFAHVVGTDITYPPDQASLL